MKKLIISLCILTPAVILTSCTIRQTTYVPAYTTTTWVAPVGYYSTVPAWSYASLGYDSWYGGTPDYYDTSIFISD